MASANSTTALHGTTGLSPLFYETASGQAGIVAVMAVFFFLARKKPTEKKRPWPTVPGRLPLLGNWHKIGSVRYLIRTVEQWCYEYGAEYGLFDMKLGTNHVTVVCGEAALTELVKWRVPGKMSRPREIRDASTSGGVHGVYTCEHAQWRVENKLIRACLNHKNIADCYMTALRTVAQRLTETWAAQCRAGPISVLDYLANSSSDVMALVAMNKDFDSVRNPDSMIAHDVHAIATKLPNRAMSPFPFWKIPVIGQHLDGCGGAIHRLTSIFENAVTEAEISQAEGESEVESDDKTYLEKLLSLTKTEKIKLERIRLTGSVMLLFSAGTDTTSKTMAHGLYRLAQDKELQQVLRDEVLANLPNNTTATMQELHTKLPRLKSFMHELHRHYGSPCTFWYTDVDIPYAGSVIPKNTRLMIMQHHVSSNTVNPASAVPLGPHGEHPSVWCPERYLAYDPDDGTKLLPTPNPSTKGGAFSGFGNGVRNCPGRSLAETFSFLVLSSVLKEFEWDLACPANAKIIFDILFYPDTEIKLKFTKRSCS